MNFTRVTAMYFSATGTTERTVKAIADPAAGELGAGSACFDFTLPAVREGGFGSHGGDPTFGPEDLVVFGTPVIEGRVPNVLLKYLGTVVGGGAAAVPVVVYGNRNYDDALIELRDILEGCGFRTAAAAAFIGEHSFSDVLAAGRPDEKDIRVAEAFGKDVAAKLKSIDEIRSPVAVKGHVPLRPYYKPRDRAGNPVNILKVKPKTDPEKCVRCMTCVQVCLMGSIDMDDVSVVSGICMKCCACVKKCPHGAKYFDDPRFLYHKRELELGYARRAEPELFL
ncbi:MAG: 4Fe-4S binding protein [Anaerovoracaceae bacterium]|nr:4Fe-4S binding protein [Anaerovoracaceae bacterium]